MKKIPLGGKNGSAIGNYALVDDEDYEFLKKFTWHARYCKRRNVYYASRAARVGENGSTLSMHRLITLCPPGLVVDHINHNTLDNRKKNLRVCTHHQNTMNRKKGMKNTTGHTGVYKRKERLPWYATIGFNGKDIWLGSFATKKQAIEAARKARKEYFGEYAPKEKGPAR
jgi:HNH endonuclease